MTTQEQAQAALKSMNKIQWYEADFEEHCESGWDLQDSGYFVNVHYETIRAALEAIAQEKVVDVEMLMMKNDYIPTTKRERDLSNYGWNRCINYLAAQGYLTQPTK